MGKVYTGLVCAILKLSLVIVLFSGCEKSALEQFDWHISFRDIPGITAQEIEAVEQLQKQYQSFVYGMLPNTEAFLDEYGNIRGFSALFCEWLTGLFGIEFIPAQYDWSDLISALADGEVDFTGELTANEERRKIYYMTDPIAERTIDVFSIADRDTLSEIAASRPLRYAFLENTTTIDIVLSSFENSESYELFFVSGIEQAYDMLKSGEADAFFSESKDIALFNAYGDVIGKPYFPLYFSPVSMSTQNPALQPVINIVQKVLQNGEFNYLAEMYSRGNREYMRYIFTKNITEEERAYINSKPVIRYVTQYTNYPVSFYNEREKQWQGIAFDLLDEIEELTGLSFQLAHGNELMPSPVLLEMVETGKAAFITELMRTEARAGRFIWLDTVLTSEYLTLASGSEQRAIRLNEVRNFTVGVVKDTPQTEAFMRWFPNHGKIVEYDDTTAAFTAMRAGDIDLVMTSSNNLLVMTNYMELTGFKANIVFDNFFLEASFGFNVNEVTLRSIIDKALYFVDVKTISDDWRNKAFDYRYKLIEAQRPWLVGAIVLLFFVFILLVVLFMNRRDEEIRLKGLVAERTRELKAAEEMATNASETKSRFIANMSHEMRTPMNVVIGLTELMLEDNIPSGIKDKLKKINTAGSTLLGLINDVLDISKIEAGKIEFTPVQYDMAGFLNDIITLNMIRIEDKPITFRLDISDELPFSLYGDDLRLKQILNNLLSNAFKYSKEGTVTLGISCVRKSVHEGNDDVRMDVYVSDTGIGIRENDLTKLFSDYHQVDTRANRKIEGTGLGLSITKKLVEHMGGKISVESEYGKGTVFRLHIRQRYVCDKTIGAETAEKLRSFGYSDTKKRASEKLVRADLSFAKVLAVDDMKTNLDVAAGLLRKYKLHVDCVLSGQEAVDKIRAGEPAYNAVFMDHMMPGMDGIETVHAIRALDTDYSRNIPVIALTANAIQGTENMFYANGFQGFLSKPINIMELDSILRKWVKDTHNTSNPGS